MNEKQQESLKAKAKEVSSASTSIKGNSKKRSESGNPSELQFLKKGKPARFYQHCKNKGGPHLTHNTKECCRCDKDGNPIAMATLKPSDAKKPFKKGGDKQMAYLTATFESLVKKGLKKAMKSKMRKRHSYDLSSSDSDSESEIRCRDTEQVVDVVDKHLKLDEPFCLIYSLLSSVRIKS
jgi:hypothetical protein